MKRAAEGVGAPLGLKCAGRPRARRVRDFSDKFDEMEKGNDIDVPTCWTKN